MGSAVRIALVLWVLACPSAGRAADAVTRLEALRVQLWPDYDRPSVLVMLTGTLPSSEPLPALVNLPLLPDAQINAVAREGPGGALLADVTYTAEAGKLSLSTPSPGFRVEYYVPYRIVGDERTFHFEWLADVSVEALSLIVQQPAAATSLVTRPPASTVSQGRDGLTYHVLPVQDAPAREPRAVELSYAAPPTALTAGLRAAAAPEPAPARPPAPAPGRENRSPDPAVDASTGWALILALFATAGVSAAITWQVARSRLGSGADGEKPGSQPPARRPCPGCGLPCRPGDRFCTSCGRELPPAG